jgi:hypothetical protein
VEGLFGFGVVGGVAAYSVEDPVLDEVINLVVVSLAVVGFCEALARDLDGFAEVIQALDDFYFLHRYVESL